MAFSLYRLVQFHLTEIRHGLCGQGDYWLHDGLQPETSDIEGRYRADDCNSTSQSWINRFRSSLVHRCKFPFRARKFDKISKFFKFKMADGRYIEYRLWLSRGHIGRLMRISVKRWRTTYRCRSCDPNGNFRKFNMADGRHFENSFISISQSWIIRFRSNLFRRCKFPFRSWLFHKKIEIFQIQDGGQTPYWKSFLAISRLPISRLTRNSEWRWRITCR